MIQEVQNANAITKQSPSSSSSTSSTATTQPVTRNFHSDLAESNGPVYEAKSYLESLGYVVVLNDTTSGESLSLAQLRTCDLTAWKADKAWEKFLIEVKLDRKWKETGNVALESKALLHSSSDYVFYKLKGIKGLRKLTLALALKLIRSGKYRAVTGGDFNDLLTLIPLRAFIELTEAL